MLLLCPTQKSASTLAELFSLGQKGYALGILPDHQEGNGGDEREADLEHELEAADIYTLPMHGDYYFSDVVF